MLSRRVLRIKAMQALYAFIQSGSDRIDKAEKAMLLNTDGIFDLYVYQLSALAEVVEAARRVAETGRMKYFPTDEERDPQMRFIGNRVIRMIEDNPLFRKRFDELKINWAEEQELFRKIFNRVRESQEYQDYMNSSINNFEKDRVMAVNVFRDNIAGCEELENIFEEMNIHWAGDFDIVSYLIIKSLNTLVENAELPIPRLDFAASASSTGRDENEDRTFMLDLFRKSIIHGEEFEKLIAMKAENWELERIAMMDSLLLRMALAELTCMPSIPVKVTLNEYIEISKIYSSAKSKIFINGVLDKLILDLKQQGRIVKTGRGLME